MVIADQLLVKKINQKIILNEIAGNSPISRARLSEVTGLNKSTISSQVSTLIEKQLIFTIGQGQSSGGRKPVMLVFNKNAGYSIGIDIGVTNMNGILTDLKGNIVHQVNRHLHQPAFEERKNQLIETIKLLIEQMPESPYGLVGIGVCVPGLVSTEQKIIFTPNIDWDYELDLTALIKEEFGVPVFLENEANAGGYGEKVFGSAKEYKDIVYLSVGTGIGAGLIIDNSLYRGVGGFAGEIGHVSIDANGPKCSCGNRGCWELYASEKALLKSLPAQLLEASSEEIIELANQNDPETLMALQNFGHYLGIGLTNILNTFNPQAVILRNDLIEALPMVLNSIRNSLSSRIYNQLEQNGDLLLSSLGNNASAIGASSLVIEHFMETCSA